MNRDKQSETEKNRDCERQCEGKKKKTTDITNQFQLGIGSKLCQVLSERTMERISLKHFL